MTVPAETSRIQLAYKVEAAFGTNPAGTGWQKMRIVAENLRRETDTEVSDEIRADRQVPGMLRMKTRGVGDIDFLLSHTTHDDWIRAAVQSSGWSSPVTAGPASIDAVASTGKYEATGAFSSFTAYSWVYVAGFTTAANNGFKKIKATSENDITVHDDYSLIDETGSGDETVTQGAQIINGTHLDTFQIEKQYTDLTTSYQHCSGFGIDALSLDVPVNGKIGGRFGLIGKDVVAGTAALGTGYTDATTNQILSSVDNLSEFRVDGVAHAGVSFSLQLQNALRERLEYGTLGATSLGSGTIDLTGTFEHYFDDSTALAEYEAFTERAFALITHDPADETYMIFDFPSVRHGRGEQVTPGRNEDFMARFDWTAYLNTAEDVTMRVARFDL